MLTKKQQELLTYLHRHIRSSGVSPSFEEMKEHLQLRSKSGVHRLITALEERGFIRRLAHRARAIEVLKLPHETGPGYRDVASVAAEPVETAEESNIIPTDFSGRESQKQNQEVAGEVVSLPLLGAIAAGTPIEALRDPNNFIDVPASFLDRGEHFALEVAGDSMIDAGILDGDTAIVRRCDMAENGAIVVALIDDQEATLKRLRRKGNSVALEPANKSYETRIFPPNRVRIQGRLLAILRRY